MRKFWVFILLIVVSSGCGSTFKSQFRDFNAYYNTYYNAKKSYNRGLKKSLEQNRVYNTLQPIRIYETPKGAGSGDFDNAIDKGASILRKYDDTKWVDNALEIIGKSYFFRNEYFNAIQKFEELYINAEDIVLKQSSIFWKGRVLLELQAYNEGIQFLNEELSINEGEWRSSLEWQIKVVLAEHYIANDNWVNALDLLNESVGKIPDRANNERGYFLIGQLNEQVGNTKAAFDAYDMVEKYYNNYDLQFAAKKKKAEVARDLGNIDEAIKVFQGMIRDDKNTEFVSELNYELGKSEQIKGNWVQAQSIYLSILQDPFNKPNSRVKALTYNGIAELNRFYFDNYTYAAAYYDSSARLNISKDQLPDEYDARNLADSFGAYANLKYQIHEQDSLLGLGLLSEEAFDSVLKELEAKKLAELERLREEQEAQRNTLVNVGGDDSNEQNQNSENGFLNVRNPVLISDATQRFQAFWGARPLVDNWRVNSLIINILVDDSTQNGSDAITAGNTSSLVNLDIDLSRIPFTISEQDSVKDIIAKLKYELGNLFFLQLELPDSANHYFKEVVDERPKSDIVPITLYSLSELNDIQDNELQSRVYANQLIELFPNTEYAERVATKFDLTLSKETTSVKVNPIELYYKLLEDDSSSGIVKAEKLAKFAIEFSDEAFSDQAMYSSIKEYIEYGKTDSVFNEKYQIWSSLNQSWLNKEAEFSSLKDSIITSFQDTSNTFTSEDSLLYKTIADSILIKPDLSEYFPYVGVVWDSTRAKISLFGNIFTNSKLSKQVRILKNEFEILVIEEQVGIQKDPDDQEPESVNDEYISCNEHEFILEIRGGVELIDESIQLSPNLDEETIVFMFYVNQRGIIDEFELSSNTQNQELISTYSEAIDALISFEPVLIEGMAQKVVCEIEFILPR